MSLFSTILGVVTTVGSGALSASGEVDANEENAQQLANLEATERYVAGLLAPFENETIPQLAPGGFLRDALAAEDIIAASTEQLDAQALSRAAGSRVSQEESHRASNALFDEIMGRGAADRQADMDAASALADFGLEQLGYSDLFSSSKSTNDNETYSDLLQYVGRNLS